MRKGPKLGGNEDRDFSMTTGSCRLIVTGVRLRRQPCNSRYPIVGFYGIVRKTLWARFRVSFKEMILRKEMRSSLDWFHWSSPFFASWLASLSAQGVQERLHTTCSRSDCSRLAGLTGTRPALGSLWWPTGRFNSFDSPLVLSKVSSGNRFKPEPDWTERELLVQVQQTPKPERKVQLWLQGGEISVEPNRTSNTKHTILPRFREFFSTFAPRIWPSRWLEPSEMGLTATRIGNRAYVPLDLYVTD